jgi:hypothetical protein
VREPDFPSRLSDTGRGHFFKLRPRDVIYDSGSKDRSRGLVASDYLLLLSVLLWGEGFFTLGYLNRRGKRRSLE